MVQARFSAPAGTKRRLMLLLVIAVFVAVYPIRFDLQFFRPELIALWSFTLGYVYGYRTPLVWLLVIGLVQSVLEGSIFGAHSLALIFIAASTASVSQRLRGGSEAQRVLWLLLMVVVHQGLMGWIAMIAGKPPSSLFTLLVPAVVTALAWLPIRRWLQL